MNGAIFALCCTNKGKHSFKQCTTGDILISLFYANLLRVTPYCSLLFIVHNHSSYSRSHICTYIQNHQSWNNLAPELGHPCNSREIKLLITIWPYRGHIVQCSPVKGNIVPRLLLLGAVGYILFIIIAVTRYQTCTIYSRLWELGCNDVAEYDM